MKKDVIDGVLVIDKPRGPTSHDVVWKTRKVLRTKAGHTGTLDPLASGVLPLVLGRATRLAKFFSHSDKEYIVSIRFGLSTDSYDLEGRVLSEKPVPDLCISEVESLLQSFRGRIEQYPPMFSAVKVNGERLYKAARRNEAKDRPLREVEIKRLRLIEWSPPVLVLDIECSAGTYIRSLAHDLGERLLCGACLQDLTRTRSGSFQLEQALKFSDIADQWQDYLIPMKDSLPDLPAIHLNQAQAHRVCHGNIVEASESAAWDVDRDLRMVYQEDLLAVGRSVPGGIQPYLVLRTDLKQN